MKNQLLVAALLAGILTLNSCSDISQTDVAPKQTTISADVAARITALGFSAKNAVRVSDGYLVEKDIVLTDEVLQSGLPKLDGLVPKEEQYRTSALVTGLPRTIKVKVSTSLSSGWVTATDEMISRYNALNLRLKFQRITSGTANVNIIKDETLPTGVLGSAGFPSGGNPFGTIRMKPSTFGSGATIAYAATVLAHEMGHCIGFRHTDYFARVCDGQNEGAGSIGAIYIPGTATGIDSASWMISCTGGNVPFSSLDQVALKALYL
jgi:Dual-action HEIGH metallo-peptidase